MPEETPTGRFNRNGWASSIPLVTVLVVVAGGGGAIVQSRWTSSELSQLRSDLTVLRGEVRELQSYRIAHEAMTTPMMQKFIDEHAQKPGPKRKP